MADGRWRDDRRGGNGHWRYDSRARRRYEHEESSKEGASRQWRIETAGRHGRRYRGRRAARSEIVGGMLAACGSADINEAAMTRLENYWQWHRHRPRSRLTITAYAAAAEQGDALRARHGAWRRYFARYKVAFS